MLYNKIDIVACQNFKWDWSTLIIGMEPQIFWVPNNHFSNWLLAENSNNIFSCSNVMQSVAKYFQFYNPTIFGVSNEDID